MDGTIASAIIDSMGKWARKPADYYPTPPDVTQALIDHLDLPEGVNIWEPACGDGAMSRVLSAAGHVVVSSDLREDSGYGQQGIDFLKAEDEYGVIDWVITNPPFKVAAAFIEHALSITPNVAMLLKSQFWHARSRIELFEKYPPAEILALTWRPAFLEAERGSSPLMDVMWVIWREGITAQRYLPVRRPISIALPSPETLGDLLTVTI